MTPAAAAAAIKEARDLNLPAGFRNVFVVPDELDVTLEAGQALVRFFGKHLTEEGQAEFCIDLLDALEESKEANDLRPLQRVIHSYYRTSLFIRDAGFFPALFTRTNDDVEIETPEKLRELLGLDPN